MVNSPAPLPVNHPRGLWPTKVDDKGRLKLPANFIQYLSALQVTTVFITSFDKTTCTIYTTEAWNANVRTLQNGPNKQYAKELLFLANHYGSDAESDSQGRLMLPTELRRLLKMENSQVWLQAFEGAIKVFTDDGHKQQLEQAEQNLPEKREYMDELGLI